MEDSSEETSWNTHLGPGLLVASPQLHDPFFANTVVLLCRHEEDGAMGIVINRTTDLEMESVLKDLTFDFSGTDQREVLWGGPVEPSRGTIIFRTATFKAPEALEISDEIRVSGSIAVLEKLLMTGGSEADWFLTLGYAGWGPGQLEDEIEEGSWIVLPLDVETVFEAAVEDRWDRCIATLGVDASMIFMRPIDE